MLPALIAKIGMPALVQILSGVLSQIDTPVTKGAAGALDKVDAAIKTGEVSPQAMIEANRHAETMARMDIESGNADLSQINQSLRAEIASNDAYVRRMRPTFGYLMALTWAAQMFAIAYVIVFETEKSAFVLNAMGNLSAIWGIGLSVLGIYVYKRSEEKRSGITGAEVIGWNKAR